MAKKFQYRVANRKDRLVARKNLSTGLDTYFEKVGGVLTAFPPFGTRRTATKKEKSMFDKILRKR